MSVDSPPTTSGAGADPTAEGPPDVLGDTPRRIRSLGPTDRREYAMAAAAAICGALALCWLLDWTSPVTFLIWVALLFLAVEYALVRDRAGGVVATDRVMTMLIWGSGGIAVAILGWMITYVVVKGVQALSFDFFTDDRSDVGPLDPGGGALHSIIGTLQQTAIATAIAVPLGILTAVYLNEIKGRGSGVVRFVNDAMSGLPSIIAGLLLFTVWVTTQGFSGFAAALALTVVMLPIVTRTAEEMLRTVDMGLRESALALGSPHWRTVLRVVLPTARAGLITAALLGVARVVGETAPVLLTAFGSSSINTNPLSGNQDDLPLYVWQLIRQPNEAQIERAWTGALVLIGIVLILFTLARYIGNRGERRRGGRR